MLIHEQFGGNNTLIEIFRKLHKKVCYSNVRIELHF